MDIDDEKLYVLDTNIWIAYLIGNQKVVDKIQEIGLENCFLIDFVYYELQFWAKISNNPDDNQRKLMELFWNGEVATMEDKHIMEDLQSYGEYKAKLYKENKQMDMLSLMLAILAYPYYIMVTDRVDEFAKFDGLRIENWLE